MADSECHLFNGQMTWKKNAIRGGLRQPTVLAN
jgi:hypothetical protein